MDMFERADVDQLSRLFLAVASCFVVTNAVAEGPAVPGKWHVSPDGRYCVTIEWKRIATEDWCRYVFKTSEGFYASKSDQNRAEKVYRLWINGN